MLSLEDADVDLLLMDPPKEAVLDTAHPTSEGMKVEDGTSGVPPAVCFGEQHHQPIVFEAKAETKDEQPCEDEEMPDVQSGQKKKKKTKRRNKPKKPPPQKMIYTDYSMCHGNFPPARVIESAIHLEHRMDTTMDIPRRQDTLHVFGVDIMGTSDIFGYFREFKPRSVEWLNDSSCNVVLANEDCLAEALDYLGRPVPAGDMPKDAIKDKNFCMMYLWYRARPFLKGAARGHGKDKIDPVHLMLRMASVEDTRPAAQPKVTRKLWMQDRQQMKEVLHQDSMLDHELAEHNNRKRKPWRNEGAPAKKNKKRNWKKKQGQKKEKDDSSMMLSEEVPAANHPTTAANLMPSDLRDFITKLRAVHDAPGAGANQSELS